MMKHKVNLKQKKNWDKIQVIDLLECNLFKLTHRHTHTVKERDREKKKVWESERVRKKESNNTRTHSADKTILTKILLN